MKNSYYFCDKASNRPVITAIIAATLLCGTTSTSAEVILQPQETIRYTQSSMPLYIPDYKANCIKEEISGYNAIGTSNRDGSIMEYNTLAENMEILDSIAQLEEGWNDNGAPALDKNLIEKMKGIILVLPVQPEIFPTARPSIQFEYEKDNGDYLEFELLENQQVKIYTSTLLNGRSSRIIDFDIDEVIKVVNAFYE